MSDTVTIPRDRWERVARAAQAHFERVADNACSDEEAWVYAEIDRGDLDDIPADTERPSVEAMLDELVIRGYTTIMGMGEYCRVRCERWPPAMTVQEDAPDWRSALREAYEQAVGQADRGEGRVHFGESWELDVDITEVPGQQ